MVTAAERNSEFIADLATECLALRKAEMMGICGPSTANQARMLGDRSDVIPVTHAAGFGYGQHALLDRMGASSALRFRCRFNRLIGRRRFGCFRRVYATDAKGFQPRLEGQLDSLCVCRGQLVLVSEALMGPRGGAIT